MSYIFNSQYLTLDASRCGLHEELIKSGACSFADAWSIFPALTKMIRGDRINDSENRAVGHMYQRFVGQSAHRLIVNERMHSQASSDREEVCEWVKNNKYRFKHIVNIGIGGSYLGNRLLSHYGLAKYGGDGRTITFITNDDIGQWHSLDHTIGKDIDDTIFIICSKSFKTEETIRALHRLRQIADVNCENIVAVTNNVEAAKDEGIETVFFMPDWVGGRFSVWGSCGLAARLYLGNDLFEQFLAGGRSIDEHVTSTPPEHNIPLILALIDHHYHSGLAANSRCIAPYSEALRFIPTYFQQLEMESLGKPNRLDHSLAVWGEIGPDCQHSYFQLIHQGPKVIPVEFILEKNAFNQELNLAAIAQAKALYESHGDALSPYRVSTLLAIDGSIEGLGALLATYEYKIFFLAQILGMNAFDQPGVEHGKLLMAQLSNGKNIDDITKRQLEIVGIK